MLHGERSRLLSLMQLFKHKVHEPNYPTYNDQFNVTKMSVSSSLRWYHPAEVMLWTLFPGVEGHCYQSIEEVITAMIISMRLCLKR